MPGTLEDPGSREDLMSNESLTLTCRAKYPSIGVSGGISVSPCEMLDHNAPRGKGEDSLEFPHLWDGKKEALTLAVSECLAIGSDWP